MTASTTTQEQLRTFHLTGRGLEEWLPQAAEAPQSRSGPLLEVYRALLKQSRGIARKKFLEKAKQVAARAEELLTLDDAHRSGSSTSEQIAAALGAESGFFRTGALEKAFSGEVRPSHAMSPEQRARCEATFADLRQALNDQAAKPALYLFHTGDQGVETDAWAQAVPNPCGTALTLCVQELEQWERMLRALRMARLEIEGAFDPALHGSALARFDWQTADAEEVAALPVIVALERAEKLATSSLNSYARLLRSGYPVQILAPWGGFSADIAAVGADLGLLSMVQRDALVVQSSLKHMDHLRKGLARMATSLRPSVAVVEESPASMMFPLYCFDPDQGATFREHLELEPEPSPELSPEQTSVLIEALPHHFRVVPESAWDGGQMEWKEYLAQYAQAPPLAIPYLMIAGPEGAAGEQRVAVTRELVCMFRGRKRALEMLSEMAGGADRAKRQGATEAIEQVLALLSEPQGA